MRGTPTRCRSWSRPIPPRRPPIAGCRCCWSTRDTPGFVVSRDLGKLGYKGTESCEVSLQDVRVPPANLLGGEEGRGLQQALSAPGDRPDQRRVQGSRRRRRGAGASTCLLAKLRHAFGRPIAEFQAIQLKLADMATEINAARLLTWWAAADADSGARADVADGHGQAVRLRGRAQGLAWTACAFMAPMAIPPNSKSSGFTATRR